MRVLIVTKIFPNAVEPLSAPFNRQQFAALANHCDVEVLATIPWFPGASLLGQRSSAGALAAVPAAEEIAGLRVRHPRTLFLPRMAHGTWGPLYAASLAPLVPRYRGRVDVVLGSWAYPDGFAAVLFAQALGVPAVVKLHGSDINSLAEMPGPRRMLQWALPRAARIVAVSRALADKVVELGVAPSRIALVSNGVDSERFTPRDRQTARHSLKVPADARLALYVGNLKPAKGVLDLLSAAAAVVDANPRNYLALVGGGESASAIAEAATALGPERASRVLRLGALSADQVALWMAACDILVLPSWNEGTPNVVLEALASGRRVVASNVGGVPDLLTDATLGVMVPPRQPAQLAATLIHQLTVSYDPTVVAAKGARGGWATSAEALFNVLRDAVAVR
ncbi:MAG: glycosyltransferase family 4 protein [Kofleriaceae bacterium]|nr:glycosyltransferase family 4 protein [Kofleriaceae bacterium]